MATAPTLRPRSDLAAALAPLAGRIAVAVGALAGLVALLAGAPVHVASGRGLAGWFLTLALLRLVRRGASWSALAPPAERNATAPATVRPMKRLPESAARPGDPR